MNAINLDGGFSRTPREIAEIRQKNLAKLIRAKVSTGSAVSEQLKSSHNRLVNKIFSSSRKTKLPMYFGPTPVEEETPFYQNPVIMGGVAIGLIVLVKLAKKKR